MALNINSSLEIVKRAGFGSCDKMVTGKSERRMADSQRISEEESRLAEEQAEPVPDETFEEIDYHRNPEKMTHEQLLDINDL